MSCLVLPVLSQFAASYHAWWASCALNSFSWLDYFRSCAICACNIMLPSLICCTAVVIHWVHPYQSYVLFVWVILLFHRVRPYLSHGSVLASIHLHPSMMFPQTIAAHCFWSQYVRFSYHRKTNIQVEFSHT